MGVLSKFCLDDGRGLARAHVLQHVHEKAKGQSSAVALELLGFEDSGTPVVPAKFTGRHVKDFREIASKAARCVTLVDLCGHESFLKTTVFGLCGLNPNVVFLVVGANAGVQKMTREHLGLAVALQLPVVIIVTKIDMAPKHVLEETMTKVDRILRLAQRKKYGVCNADEAREAADAMASSNVAPVFKLSCTTGEGVDLLRGFLSSLVTLPVGAHVNTQPPPAAGEDGAVETEWHIDHTYLVPGVGLVVGGSLLSGVVRVGDTLELGPDLNGDFRPVRVASIHRQCVPVERVYPGQQSTLAIKATGAKEQLKRGHIRKGMVLLSEAKAAAVRETNAGRQLAVWEFEAEVKVLHHSTTIAPGYSPTVHLQTVRQSAKLVAIELGADGEKVVLRSGSTAVVRFRFNYRPEYISVGRPLVFREGMTKGVGKVVRLL